MLLDNLEVKHKVFGTGTVTAVNGKYLTVAFAAEKKTFVYPDAFESFLTLADGAVPEEILADIAATKEVKERIENEKEEENRRAMTHGIVIPGKEILPEEKEEDPSQEE